MLELELVQALELAQERVFEWAKEQARVLGWAAALVQAWAEGKE